MEDDIRIAKNIAHFLGRSLFVVDISDTVEDALFRAETINYDLLILDWMLPDGSGVDLCKQLREKKNTTPILILTARAQTEDVVFGLQTGADDYLIKPFEMAILLARVKALLRRQTVTVISPTISVADLTLDTNTRQVMRGGKEIELAPKEFSLLEHLVKNNGRAVDRMEILEHVWGETVDEFSNTVDVHIRYLRKKIDEPFKKHLIQTVKQKGYMICET